MGLKVAVGDRLSSSKFIRDGSLVDLQRERGFTRPPWRDLRLGDQVAGFPRRSLEAEYGRETIPRKRKPHAPRSGDVGRQGAGGLALSQLAEDRGCRRSDQGTSEMLLSTLVEDQINHQRENVLPRQSPITAFIQGADHRPLETLIDGAGDLFIFEEVAQ